MIDFFNKSKVYIFIILTLCLTVINHLFYIDDFIAVPQFAHFDHWKYCQGEIIGIKAFYYKAFFIVDFIWSFFLLWILCEIVINYCCQQEFKDYYKESWVNILTKKWLYQILFGLTWLSDVGENIFYLVLKDQKDVSKYYLPEIVKIKIILYTICGILFLIVLIKKFVQPKKITIRKYVKSSLLTLTFLILIAALLTLMEQGSSLVIALLDDPLNLFGVSFMLVVLSMIFSHYPVYLLYYGFLQEEKNSQPNHSGKEWERLDGCLNYGIIVFPSSEEMDKNKQIETKEDDCKNEDEGKVNDFGNLDKGFKPYRYFLGALVYISFIYSMMFTYDKYIIQPGITGKVVLAIIAGLLGLKILIYQKNSINKTFKNKLYLSIYGSSWIVFIGTLVCSYYCGWHWSTFYLFLLFLITRSIHVFINLNDEDLKEVKNYNPLFKGINSIHLKEFGEKYSFKKKLTFVKWTGFAAVVVFFMAHIPTIGKEINPILIILCYVHLFYGAILILLKNYMYYNSNYNKKKNHLTMSFLLRNIVIVLLLMYGFKWYWNRNMNELQYLKEHTFDQSKTMEIDNFIDTYVKNDTTGVPKYYISSWGGGLRATYFNMLYLDKKQKESDGAFLNQVIAMSGVSGGSLGLNLFYSIMKENHSDKGKKLSDVIDAIGNTNFATTDITYLLGRDRLPFNQWLSRDRSIVGMKNYWSLITSRCTQLDTLTYQTYWWEGFNKLGYFPLLITNTTKTSGNYGLAFSAYAAPDKFNSIFKGATNILSLAETNKSLSFYEAMSTTERFPFFSATASIRGQGHYIDGGYFENSGILSLMNLRSYIDDKANREGDRLIILGNSKGNLIDFYITELQRDSSIKIKIEGETDYGAILKGILDTDRLGNYLSDHQGVHSKNAQRINLPYYLQYNDFIKALGGEPQELADIDTIRKTIKENNKWVAQAIDDYITYYKPKFKRRDKAHPKWDFAYPTLSRYLSGPTVNYYKAMFKCHPDLQN